jgi:hypothetical protein
MMSAAVITRLVRRDLGELARAYDVPWSWNNTLNTRAEPRQPL